MRKNLRNYVISALFVIHRYGIRNKPRLNLIYPKPPTPYQFTSISPFPFFFPFPSFSLIFLMGGGQQPGGKALSPPPPISFFPLFFSSSSSLFPFLSSFPFPSFPFFSLFFFFFFAGGGGARPARPPPPLDPRLPVVTLKFGPRRKYSCTHL